MPHEAIKTVAYILLAIVFLSAILGIVITYLVERGNRK